MAKQATVLAGGLGDTADDAIALIGNRIRNLRKMRSMPLRALAGEHRHQHVDAEPCRARQNQPVDRHAHRHLLGT